jgi:hypothetical protein
MKYFCDYCGYIGKESEFLEGECPACCADTLSGEVNEKSIPKVFHQPNILYCPSCKSRLFPLDNEYMEKHGKCSYCVTFGSK